MRRNVPLLLVSLIALCSGAMWTVVPFAVLRAQAVAGRPADNPAAVTPPASPKVHVALSQPARVPEVAWSCAISGIVSDATGTVIPNVKVTITNQATGLSVLTQTDAMGRYSVSGLQQGIYRVSFERVGFKRIVIENLSVGMGKTTNLNKTLDAASSTPVSAEVPSPKRLKRRVQRQPGDSTGAEPNQVDAENKAFEDWHKLLPYGLSEHHVDTVMRLGKASTVSFTIHGPKAPEFKPEPGSTPESLQVSPKMSVNLTQPHNPDGFKIVDEATPQNPKRVAPDGVTTWTWAVTPQQLGKLDLHIEAYVLRGDNESDKASYKSYDDTIDVHSVTLWGYLMMGLTWVLNNPAASLKWILPGGAGAAIIGKLFYWLITRKKKAAAGPQ